MPAMNPIAIVGARYIVPAMNAIDVTDPRSQASGKVTLAHEHADPTFPEAGVASSPHRLAKLVLDSLLIYRYTLASLIVTTNKNIMTRANHSLLLSLLLVALIIITGL